MITRHTWTPAEDALLREHYASGPTTDIAARIGVTPNAARQRARTLGLSKPPCWTPDVVDTVKALFPEHSAGEIAQRVGRSERAIHDLAKRLGLRKSREWIAERARQRMADPTHPGRRTQFQAGLDPWNKGQPHPTTGRTAETQFKPGNRPHTWCAIGHTRRNGDGYLERKTADTGCTRRDYTPVHHLVWRLHGGTVPRGHALVFRDRNPDHLDINNLELITRAELMRRNSVHRWPEPIKAAIRAKASLVRAINQLEKQQESHAS